MGGASLGPRPRVVLFDAGGTLVFFDAERAAAALARAGVTVDPARLVAGDGPGKRAYERYLRDGGLHADAWAVWVGEVLEHAGASRTQVPVIRAEHDRRNLWSRLGDGVARALDRLRAAGMRLGVVSNSEGTIGAMLVELGVADRFEVIVDSHHEGVQKPDPEIFWRALARMGGVAPEDAVYVGDVPRVDIAGARAAGLRAVLIDPHGWFPDADGAPRIASLTDLADAWT